MRNTLLTLTLFLVSLLHASVLHADGSVTVNTGTVENGNVPVCFAFIDAPYARSQFLISSSGLSAANGMALVSMQFSLKTASTQTFTNNWVVTLMETSATTVSTTFADVSSGAVVYTGTINWKTTTPTITFDVPFIYSGGNLLVDMRYSNSPNSTYEYNSFYGVRTTNLSVSTVAYSEPISGATQNFSPQTTFSYTNPPSCSAPQALSLSALTSTSASASWSASGGGETRYQYVLVQSGTTPNWNNASLVSSRSCTLSSLTPNTAYDLYVRSYCSQSDQSAAAKLSFHTLCAAVTPESLGTVGFESSEGFIAGMGNLNGSNCWIAANRESSDAEYIPYISDYEAYQGSNCLLLYAMKNTWTNANGAYVVLPELDFSSDTITDYELSFYAKKAYASTFFNDTLTVGIMTDPSDISTFTPVGYACVTTDEYAGYVVSLSSYSGTGGYVALMANVKTSSSSSARYAGFLVDNLSVSLTPSCSPLASVSVSDVTRTSLRVEWQSYPGVTNCTGYQVLCSTSSDPSRATETPVTISSPSILSTNITGLERNTLYYVYVRSNCGNNDGYSEWISTSVTTRNLTPDCSSAEPAVLQTDTVGVDYVPWGVFYKSYYSQQIYTASELSALGFSAGYIGRVAFLYALSSSFTKDITIYMGSTSESQMTASFLPVTQSSDPVTTTFSTPNQWYEFDLTNPFYWDGISNVVVGLLAEGSDYPGSQFSYAFVGGENSSASAYSHADYSTPDMTTGTVISYRANIRLSVCPLSSACPAVTDVHSVDVTPNTATVAWTASTGDYANTYDLYYATSPVTQFNWINPQFTNITDTFKRLTGLSVNTKYYVYIRTHCDASGHSDGTSDWSSAGVFTTDLSCATPDAFVAEQVFSDRVRLSWVNVNSASNWKIYLSGASSSTVDVPLSACQVTGDTVRYTLTGLQPESSYALQLKASCGSSGLSNFAVDTPQFVTLSNAVGFTSFTITNAEVIGSVNINSTTKVISASLRKGTDFTDIAFTAQYASPFCVAMVGDTLFTSPADFTSPVVVRVFAEDTLVYEDWTIQLVEESCATPYDISVTDIARRTATLRWSLGDSLITSFSLVVSTSPLSDPASGTVQVITTLNLAGDCSYSLTDLTRDTHYCIYIRSICNPEYSQWRSVDFTTASLEPGEPACPGVTDVTASDFEETAAVISWTACSGDYANTSDVFYTTQDTAGMVITPQITGVAANSVRITGLSPYTLYHVYVRTHCDAEGHDDGISRWVGISFRTLAVCRVPGTPVATLTGRNSVTIDWTNTSDTAAQADNFTYIFSPVAIPFADLATTTPTATAVDTVSASFSGLAVEATYHFYIRNDCGTSLGASPWDSCSFTTPPVLPAVINLEAYDITANAFSAVWQSDTLRFADESEWEVAVVPQGGTPADWSITTTRDFFAVGLSPETSYDLYVRPLKGTEYGAASMITVTTSPLSPSCVTLFDNGDMSLDAPLYVYYFDEYTKVNTIIHADSLAFMAGKDITAMTFYIGMSDGETTLSNVQIYLSEVASTVVSSPVDVSTATLVYSGTFDFSVEGPLTVPFIAPYHYSGGNLLIATQNTTAIDYAAVYFEGTEGAGSYGRGNKRASLAAVTSFGATGSFAPKTTFCYTGIGSCDPVYNLQTDHITAYSARAHWYAGATESSWQVYNSDVPLTEAELDTMPFVTVSSPVHAVSGLAQYTDYYLYVRGVCGLSEFSDWVGCRYTTLHTDRAYTISSSLHPSSPAPGFVSVACHEGDTTADGRFYEYTTPVFTASPYTGLFFDNWTSAVTGDTLSTLNPWTITASHDSLLIANFDTLSFNLNVSVAPGFESYGSVMGGGSYRYMRTQHFSATPAAHYHVVWNDSVLSNDRSVVMPAADTSFVATFLLDSHSLTLGVNDPALGSVSGAGTYDYGTSVTVTATPHNSHVLFTGWSNGETSATTTVLLTSDSSLTASFALDSHTITALVNDSSMGSVTGGGTFTHGTSVTLTATPAAHHHFLSWSNGVTTPTLTLVADTDSTVTANFAIDTHVITALPNDPTRGTVIGSGTYNYGDTALLVASAVYPYVFSRWNDAASSTTDTLRYIVRCDTTITAVFKYNEFDVIVNSNDGSMGSVSGGGAYTWGTNVTLTATPAPNHHLMYWSNGATTLSVNLTVLGDTSFTAYFAIDSFNVQVASNSVAMGTVSGSGVYPYGATALVTASPAAHHHLDSWNNGVTTLSQYVTVTKDSLLIANFAIDQHTVSLSVNKPSLGSVSGAGTYNYGSSVTVTATPVNNHSIFTGWSNGSSDLSTVINLTADTCLTANFVLDSHTITALVNDFSMGSVTGGGTFTHGTSVTLTATPAANHHFVSWSNGVTLPTLTLVADTDSTVTAVFSIDTYTLTLNVNDASLGSVTGAGTYDYGTEVTVTATPRDSHVLFTGWSSGETSATTTILLTSDSSLTASFALDSHTITALVNDSSMGSVTGGGTFTHGTSVTLTATPAAHHHFISWSNGVITPSLTLVADTDSTVTANFAIDRFTVTAAPNDPARGTVLGSGIYDYGDTAMLVAQPVAPYVFSRWDDPASTTSDTLLYIVVADTSFTAIFKYNEYDVTAITNDASMGTVSGGGIYVSGATVTLVATPAPHHHLVHWSNGDTSLSLSFTVLSDTSFTATFAVDSFTVTALVNDSSMGAVSGAGTFTYGTNVILTALPAAHHHFVSWSNGVTTPTLLIVANADSTVTASFAIDTCIITAIPNESLRGTVTGSGIYNYGDTVTLVAEAIYPYSFSYWDDAAVTTSDTLRFVATGDALITATFRLSKFDVSLSTNDPSMGTVTGAGSFVWGTTASLVATPQPHHHLVHWSNGATTNTINVTVVSDTSFVATFAIDSFSLFVASGNPSMGSVTGSGTYMYSEDALITATPAAHHHFVTWSNGVTTDTLTVEVTSDSILIANFAIDQHTVTLNVNNPSMGYVTGAGTYNYGTTVTVSATPFSPHYLFTGWSNGDTSATTTLLLSEDTVLTANFIYDSHTVAVSSSDTSMGSVSGSGIYTHGQTALLTATPVAHHHFVSWSNGVTTPIYSMVVDRDSSLVATFAINQHNVSALSDNVNQGYTLGSGNYDYGTTATLFAIPYDNYRFSHWSNGDTSTTISFTITGDTILVAYFEADQFTVTADVNDPDMGYTTGSGIYSRGDTATLTAVANVGYRFDGWSNGETSSVISLVVTSDTTLTALFSEVPTSVDDVAPDSYVAYVEYYDIVVSGASDHLITLYDMNGRLIHSVTHASALERLTVNVAGIYIIHVDHLPATRVIVR